MIDQIKKYIPTAIQIIAVLLMFVYRLPYTIGFIFGMVIMAMFVLSDNVVSQWVMSQLGISNNSVIERVKEHDKQKTKNKVRFKHN